MGAPAFSASSAGLAYETPSSLVVSPVRVVTNCRSWMAYVERSTDPGHLPGGGGAVCLRVQQVRGRRYLATNLTLFSFEEWMGDGSEVPSPPPAAAGYVRLVSVGWGVKGWRYASGGVTPRGPRRLQSCDCGPLGSGTAVEVKVAAEEVAVAVGERATWRGVRARLAPWCGLGLRCRRPLPVVFAGWVGLDGCFSQTVLHHHSRYA